MTMANSKDVSILGLDGKAIVVLGAGQGIGLACCEAFASAGARLVCVDRDPALASAAAAGRDALALSGDVTDRADMRRIIAQAADWAGGAIDGLVDIVGVADVRPIGDFDDAGWAQQFDIVVRHAFLALQEAAPNMAAGGAISFVSSMSGHRVVRNQVIYGTAKAALDHLVRGAAVEYGPRGIRVNAVAPGFVRTPRLNAALGDAFWDGLSDYVPLGAPARPDEIAGALLFLGSRLASHVTGQVLAVDGGVSVIAALPKIPLAGRATRS